VEDLTWLIVQPPEAREAVGFVDYDLAINLSPRLPYDSAYMRGWNDAKEMASKFPKLRSPSSRMSTPSND